MDRDLSLLRKRYGKVPLIHPVLASADFAPVRGSGRRSEVAMAIRRPSGGILVQAKAFYPPATFRLPTGGIKQGQDVEHALLREVHEESSLEVEIEGLLAVLDHLGPTGRPVFRSYLFLLRETGGVLKVNDPQEQITAWEERDPPGLAMAAERLRALDGPWRHWGAFRALVLDARVQAFS